MKQEKATNPLKWIPIIVTGLIIIILSFGSIYTIQAGFRGVLLTFGKPSMDAKIEGLHFKMPLDNAKKR